MTPTRRQPQSVASVSASMTSPDAPPAPAPAPSAGGVAAVSDAGALVEAAQRTAEEVLKGVGSSASGLTSDEARARLARQGLNLITQRRITALDVLAVQLRNPLLLLLLGAAAISGATGDPTDAVIIAAIVVLSVGLGFVNEYRAAQAVAALHGDIHHEAVVWRDGARNAGRRRPSSYPGTSSS